MRGVSKSFREGDVVHAVLEAVDLDVGAGGFIALLGRSGTGKSTILNLISGIDLPDAGEVRVAGTLMSAVGEPQRTLFRRRHIGFVFQFFNLLGTLSVEENVLLPVQLKEGRHAAGASERVRELLGRVGLADRRASFPDVLSGGEQQRVAIARALAHDPDLVLADEPTGNLDVEVGGEVLDLLCELARDRGKTLIVATHSHEVAARADRILSIRDRRLVEIPRSSP